MKETVLQEAQRLISGDRNAQYGKWETEATAVTAMYMALPEPRDVKPTGWAVTVQMILLKLVRESSRHKRDNIVDACGYLGLLGQLQGDDHDDNPKT